MRLQIITFSKKLIIGALVFILLAELYQFWTSYRLPTGKQQLVGQGLAGRTVILDPGHGGADPGAMIGKTREADLNMRLADILKIQLETANCKVLTTRLGDKGLVPKQLMSSADRWFILQQRREFAALQSGHIFVSIHVNSNDDSRVSGGIVYYADDYSRPLAAAIQQRLNRLSGKSRQPVKRNFTIIKGNDMPSVLIEAGFITNRHDRGLLTLSPEIPARAIFEGIQEYAQKVLTTGEKQLR